MLDNEGQIELQAKDDKDKLMWRVMMITESKIDAQSASRSSNLQVLHNNASADLFDFNILWRRNYETNVDQYLMDYIQMTCLHLHLFNL